jgi:hypothetical protein
MSRAIGTPLPATQKPKHQLNPDVAPLPKLPLLDMKNLLQCPIHLTLMRTLVHRDVWCARCWAEDIEAIMLPHVAPPHFEAPVKQCSVSARFRHACAQVDHPGAQFAKRFCSARTSRSRDFRRRNARACR